MKNVAIAKQIVKVIPIKYLQSGRGAHSSDQREYSIIPATGFM